MRFPEETEASQIFIFNVHEGVVLEEDKCTVYDSLKDPLFFSVVNIDFQMDLIKINNKMYGNEVM